MAAGDDSRCGRLAWAVLATLRYTGVRVAELCALQVADLDLDVGSGPEQSHRTGVPTIHTR